MNKFVLLALMLLVSVSAHSLQVIETTVDVYQFVGEFGGMAKSLEAKLATEILKSCPQGNVEIRNILVNYQLGAASGGDTLMGKVKLDGAQQTVEFASHPSAKATMTFRCQ